MYGVVDGNFLLLADWSGGWLARKLDHEKGTQGNCQLSDHRSHRCHAGRIRVSAVASRRLWVHRRACHRHGGRRHSAVCASKNLADWPPAPDFIWLMRWTRNGVRRHQETQKLARGSAKETLGKAVAARRSTTL